MDSGSRSGSLAAELVSEGAQNTDLGGDNVVVGDVAHQLARDVGNVVDLVASLDPLEAVLGGEVVFSGHHGPAASIHGGTHELPAVGFSQVVAACTFLARSGHFEVRHRRHTHRRFCAARRGC